MASFPTHVTIPTPLHEGRKRGIFSAGALGEPIKTRLSPIGDDLVNRACELTGTTRAEFMRQVVQSAAQALVEATEGKGTTHVGENHEGS